MLALSLTSVDNMIIRTAIAAAITIAFLVIAGWLPRAWLHRRRAQVVIEDVAAAVGIPESATSGLSPQLRQAVWRLLLHEKEHGDASYAVLKTLKQDIDEGLLRTHGHVQMRTIAAELRSSTEDSLTALAAGVRAVGPAQAEGLVAALGALLPSQRGWMVRAFPVLRGEGRDADVGLTLELAQFERAPDAVTTFWASSGASREADREAAQAAAMRALYRLLEPAARWIETRLVAQQLAQSGVPMSWRLLNGGKRRQELAGLQMQLAGQMSLYAATEQEAFYRGFADQALADLREAARRLPTYFRPHSTAAAVHERLGWGYRRSDDLARASDEFQRAVRRYDTAAKLLAAAPGAAPEPPRDAALERVKVRRAKCRLLSDDRSHLEIAMRELVELLRITGSTALDLYNSACLFAVAMGCPAVPEEVRSTYAPQTWHLLGRALLAEGAGGPWGNVMTDVEFDALEHEKRRDFCTELKAQHPELTPLDTTAAQKVVRYAMDAIGVELPSNL
jgi:tetratricopeptide (TPR) repeat protein